MQKHLVANGANGDGTANNDTIYIPENNNDNIGNLFDFVISQGYTLITDDVSQLAKASKALYNPLYTYNTSAIATQSVNDIVRGSDGKYYEVQSDGIINDDPVGSVTGDWMEVSFDSGSTGLAISSTAQAQAQTDNATAISPLKLFEALQGANQNLAIAGYQKLPGGLILQWGRTTTFVNNTSETVVFPIAFPNAVFTASATCYNGVETATDGNTRIANYSNSQIRITFDGTGLNTNFIAIGY